MISNLQLLNLGFHFRFGYWKLTINGLTLVLDSERFLTITKDMTSISVGFYTDVLKLTALIEGLKC